MKASGNLISAIQSMVPLPWGMSSLLFCWGNDDETVAIMRSLKRRRVPTALVLCAEHDSRTQSEEEKNVRIHSLRDFIDTDGEHF
jgi:hypothetical protein